MISNVSKDMFSILQENSLGVEVLAERNKLENTDFWGVTVKQFITVSPTPTLNWFSWHVLHSSCWQRHFPQQSCPRREKLLGNSEGEGQSLRDNWGPGRKLELALQLETIVKSHILLPLAYSGHPEVLTNMHKEETSPKTTKPWSLSHTAGGAHWHYSNSSNWLLAILSSPNLSVMWEPVRDTDLRLPQDLLNHLNCIWTKSHLIFWETLSSH